MKNSLNQLAFLFLFSILFTNASAQKFEAESVERSNGTAFFAINSSTGQLAFMADHGKSSGIWKNYGGIIRESGASNLEFRAIERSEGTAFFAMDGATGQVYFMLDYGSNSGKWKNYGGIITRQGDGKLEFEAAARKDGTAFFAIDGKTGQVYYMLDYGSNAGKWKSFGGVIP
ncbi:MAG: hypothetical protein P1P88_23440 [Bacteroidales bacterium]|nr:hypothetical protein [Bacteroidales bacterium]